MRILITKDGENFIHDLNFSVNHPLTANKREKNQIKLKKNSSFSTYKFINKRNLKNNNNSFSKIIKSFYERNDMEIDPKELSKARVIKISKPKIIGPHIFNKYFKYISYDTSKKILSMKDSLNRGVFNENGEFFPKTNETSNNNIYKNPSNVYLKDLLSSKTCEKIKNEFINFEKEKKKSVFSHPDLFRTIFKEKKEDIETIDKVMNLTINSNRVNLIKYLKDNDNISFKFCYELSKYNEEKKYKLNKICQKIFQRNKSVQLKNKNYNTINLSKEKKEINSNIKNLSHKLQSGIQIINNYKNKKDTTKFFNNQLNEMKIKYWKKYNVDHLLRNKSNLVNHSLDVNRESTDIKYETSRNFYKYTVYKRKESIK